MCSQFRNFNVYNKVQAMEEWVMPEWMERYRDCICNTGGNPIEELMNDHTTTADNNIIRAAIIISVDSQINLLYSLKTKGFLA